MILVGISIFFRLVCAIVYGCVIVCALSAAQAQESKPLTIFAAASLTGVLNQQASAWVIQTGEPSPRLSFAASAIMARQIEAGAPADIFISANAEWISYLQKAALTIGNPVELAKNSLVFAAPASRNIPKQANLNTHTLLSLLGDDRLALADPAIAPAGAYAKNYLVRMGLWETLNSRIAYGSNVRQSLLLIERGGLMGFVYKSDTDKSSLANSIFTIPEQLSGAIIYSGTAIRGSNSHATAFLAYLSSTDAQEIWTQAGFSLPVSN